MPPIVLTETRCHYTAQTQPNLLHEPYISSQLWLKLVTTRFITYIHEAYKLSKLRYIGESDQIREVKMTYLIQIQYMWCMLESQYNKIESCYTEILFEKYSCSVFFYK